MEIDEFRDRVAAAGYDVAALDRIGTDLGVDLVPILAGWAPVILEVFGVVPIVKGEVLPVDWALPPPVEKRSWWKRLWQWLRRA